jgi:hypothetical protein
MKQLIGIVVGLGLVLAIHLFLSPGDSSGRGGSRAQERRTAVGQASSRPGSAERGEMAVSAVSAVSALRQEVAHLRDEVTALAAASRGGRAEASAQAIASLQQEVAALRGEGNQEPCTPPLTREEAARARQAQMQEVEASFWQEPVDRTWSARAADAVTAALGGDDMGAQVPVRSLECRAHSCRLELDSDETGGLAKTLPVFLSRVGETLPSVTANEVQNPDGSRSTILYMAAASGNRAAAPGK